MSTALTLVALADALLRVALAVAVLWWVIRARPNTPVMRQQDPAPAPVLLQHRADMAPPAPLVAEPPRHVVLPEDLRAWVGSWEPEWMRDEVGEQLAVKYRESLARGLESDRAWDALRQSLNAAPGATSSDQEPTA